MKNKTAYKFKNVTLAKKTIRGAGNVLVVGATGTGKSTLLKMTKPARSKYFDFPGLSSLNGGDFFLCERNLSSFNLIGLYEATLILDFVNFDNIIDISIFEDSNIVKFFNETRISGKRIIALSMSVPHPLFLNLFDSVITMSKVDSEYICETKMVGV